MGIANTFSYKQFELYIFIHTIQGGKDYYWGNDDPNSSPGLQGGSGHLESYNMPAGSWDYWMPENPDAKYRTLAQGAAKVRAPLQYTQRNFIRLQDLSISYNFRTDLLKSIGFRNIKVYASAKNLLTITDWIGMDPEIGKEFASYNMLPLMRSYTIGLNVEL